MYSIEVSTEVSWFQEHAALSLELIHETAVTRSASIIDIGGGASTLVDDLLAHGYGVWHDRAVFHFLTTEADRRAYVNKVFQALKPGGVVIVATFAEDGPSRCSGLPVMRYSAEELHAEFGQQFQLLRHERESHRTPGGNEQKFVYCVCRKVAS